MPKLLAVILASEFVIAVLLGDRACVLRHDYTNAFGAWSANPTTQTKAEWDRQVAISKQQRWIFEGVIFVVMAVATIPIACLLAGPRRSAPQSTPGEVELD